MSDKEKKEKEKFLMLTRVLMKYLEQRDLDMHTRVKAQIKECYLKNKQGDPNFKSLTTSMKARLKQTVGDAYWKKAHDYLDHFLKQKKAGQARQHAGEKHHERSFPFFVSLLPSDVLQLRLSGPNWTLAKTRRTSVKTRLVYIELLAAVWASSLSACTAFSSRDLTLTFSFSVSQNVDHVAEARTKNPLNLPRTSKNRDAGDDGNNDKYETPMKKPRLSCYTYKEDTCTNNDIASNHPADDRTSRPLRMAQEITDHQRILTPRLQPERAMAKSKALTTSEIPEKADSLAVAVKRPDAG